ncbi:MAG TPA: tRNA pseudouridine(55) synthase TruB [Thermomicrobiales bacterium]|nr:tRNA pseudouridine(55) synthase TruB [Thermomicrobiales bacterium]
MIDKPGGWTSHDVVSRVRRILGERRVGHAGTLDPAAVGVLPIAVGLATRTVEYLSEADKSYRAEITFGLETDSADGDGVVIGVARAVTVGEIELRNALGDFVGPQGQVPPMHSALKVDGKRLYELARAGEEIEVQPRTITIHAIALVNWAPPVATVDITCSKGTYVRSIARDLGRRLGTGAYLSNLVRTSTGPFVLRDAMRLGELEEFAGRGTDWAQMAFHPDTVLLDRPAVILDPESALAWIQGKVVAQPGCSGTIRVYDDAGNWLGVGTADATSQTIKADKVVPTE